MQLLLRGAVQALLAAVLVTAFPSVALSATIFVEGIVVNGEGRPIAGAAVQISGANVTLTQRTDAEGRFYFESLTVGRYLLSATAGTLAASETIDVTSAGVTLRVSLSALRTIGRVVVVRNPVAVRSGTDVSLDSASSGVFRAVERCRAFSRSFRLRLSPLTARFT